MGEGDKVPTLTPWEKETRIKAAAACEGPAHLRPSWPRGVGAVSGLLLVERPSLCDLLRGVPQEPLGVGCVGLESDRDGEGAGQGSWWGSWGRCRDSRLLTFSRAALRGITRQGPAASQGTLPPRSCWALTGSACRPPERSP